MAKMCLYSDQVVVGRFYKPASLRVPELRRRDTVLLKTALGIPDSAQSTVFVYRSTVSLNRKSTATKLSLCRVGNPERSNEVTDK
jgi:hypothetical protein